MKSLLGRLRGHFQEYVARYSVLALAVLTPLSGALGTIAANLGGADTPVGRLAVGAASALGTAAAGVVFIRNLGIWQMLDKFGTAPGVGKSGDLPMNISSALSTALAPALPATGVAGSQASDNAGSTPESEPPVPDVDTQGQLEATDGVSEDDDLEGADATGAGAA